jgi:PEGA domain
MTLRFHARTLVFVLAMASMLPGNLLHADNKVLGELQFEGATNVERGSGVWVDGQYLGYLKELKGSKTVWLLPGEHEIVIRQAGYRDFSQRVTLQPGDKRLIQVTLQKDTRLQMPAVTAEIKLSVDPDRAAVFVDGMFAGHAGELGGVGEGLLVAPGKRRITISLPGYRNFETDVELAPNQKFEIKTKLIKVAVSQE